MRALSTRCLALLLAVFLAISAFAQPALRPLPPLLRTLNDEVGVLSADEGRRLSRAIEEVTDRTGTTIVMVIAETTKPQALEDYGERLAQRWRRERGLDTDRSIFVVLSVQERELQVMPGKALHTFDRGPALSGAVADLGPLFREQRYFDALMKLTDRLAELIRKDRGATRMP